ncbi:hypothetical protein Godav_017966, partial [Gossypium davidsonii]|nr:hypothetical protein [Gossypium davidsonii]
MSHQKQSPFTKINDKKNGNTIVSINQGKWVSEIREPRKKSRIWLGTFATPEMAACTHDVATLSIKGEFTILNFPHLVILLPQPVSLMPRDIQVAAVKAASRVELEEPKEFTNVGEDDDGNLSIANNGELFRHRVRSMLTAPIVDTMYQLKWRDPKRNGKVG